MHVLDNIGILGSYNQKKEIVVPEYVETYLLVNEFFSGGERLIYEFD